MLLKDILGGWFMKRFFIWFVLVLVFFSIPGSADNVDISSMTFEELVELRSEIDIQLMLLDPEYDLILDNGDYYVGLDIPCGKVMMHRLNLEEEVSICYCRDSNDELVDHYAVTEEHPRKRIGLPEDGMITIKYGPIGLKYLND